MRYTEKEFRKVVEKRVGEVSDTDWEQIVYWNGPYDDNDKREVVELLRQNLSEDWEPNDREKRIIRLARRLQCQLGGDKSTLDKATICANFLFRFDPAWCKRVSRIRRMMRVMMGLTGDGPLSNEDGVKWLSHLDNNAGLQIRLEIGPDDSRWTISTERGGYICFDQKLREALSVAIEQAIRSGDTTELERLQWLEWRDANQTSKIQEQLWSLARWCNLVPPKHKQKEWAHNEIQRQYQRVVCWVVWGEAYAPVPSFPSSWDGILLLESRPGDGKPSSVTSWRLPGRGHWRKKKNGGRVWVEDNSAPPKQGRKQKEVWIRTLAIHYLTKRGGGRRTEQQAVDLWKDELGEEVIVTNFQKQRDRLYSRGAKKKP